MVLDLNNFKQINDTLGHRAGDVVLTTVASRLREVVRIYDEVAYDTDPGKTSTIARLGGDEFLIAIQDLSSGEDAAGIARRILDALRAPLRWESRDLFISGSIGVSLFPDDGSDVDELVRHADTAVHQAKEGGPNTIAFFNRAMNELVTQRLFLETELRRALDDHAIVAHYQPLVDGRSGRIVGVEALARWTHPELGAVSPAQFVPLAERLGLIDALTTQTVKGACAELLAWSRQGLPPVYASINISGQQFRDKDLAATICALVRGEGVEPERITLEVTESVLVENLAEGERALCELKAHGFRIAIDDFGTGYSSLSYLKRFPIDVLKIDRAFVRDADRNPRDATILAAIIGLAQALGVESMAEGVETVEQRDVLLASECHMMQGFLFSKAVPAAELAALLARGVAAQPEGMACPAAAGRG